MAVIWYSTWLLELDAQQLAAVCGEICPTTRLAGGSVQRSKRTNQEESHIGVIGRKMDEDM
jgi:hypothetical protein